MNSIIVKRIIEITGEVKRIDERTRPRIYTFEPLMPSVLDGSGSNGDDGNITVAPVVIYKAQVSASSGTAGPPSTWLYDLTFADGVQMGGVGVLNQRSANIKYQPIPDGTIVLIAAITDNDYRILNIELPEEYACGS